MLSISGYLSGPFTFNLPGVELLWRCKQRHSTANDQSSPNNRFPVPFSRPFACFAGNPPLFSSRVIRWPFTNDRSSPSNISLFPFRVLSRVSRAILFFFPLAYFAGRSQTAEVHQATLSLFPFRVLSRISRAILLSFPHACFSGH
jgi:hypothetical protein